MKTITAEIKDQITTPPAIEGKHGRAWRCDLAEGRRRKGFAAEDDATLIAWVIEAPWAHPAWHSYELILLHLRPMPDRRQTIFYLDEATHELWLYALNPDKDRNHLIATGIATDEWLTPGNFAAQIIEVSDDLALARVRQAVALIVAGQLSPDTDYIGQWARLFGDNMMKDRANRRPPKVRP
jgi:hypothetical protein